MEKSVKEASKVDLTSFGITKNANLPSKYTIMV